QETVAGRKGLDSERTQRLDQLDEIAATLNDDERRRVVLFRRAEFAQEAADREGQARAIDGLRDLVERDGDVLWLGRLRESQMRFAIELGRLDEAWTAAHEALEAYLRAGDANGEAQARTGIAEVATLRGDLAEAERLLEAARSAAERASDAQLTLRLLR